MKYNFNKYLNFHGCESCRDCCNGKLFSLGEVGEDFRNIVKLFPTVIDTQQRKLLFMFSITPGLGCHYFNHETQECTIYNFSIRPNTCINYPFKLNDALILEVDALRCNAIDDTVTSKSLPLVVDSKINPNLMNNFFTETQFEYIKNGNRDLENFISFIIDNDLLLELPTIKLNGKKLDLSKFNYNKQFKIIDCEKANTNIKNELYKSFLNWHELSLDHFVNFSKKAINSII